MSEQKGNVVEGMGGKRTGGYCNVCAIRVMLARGEVWDRNVEKAQRLANEGAHAPGCENAS